MGVKDCAWNRVTAKTVYIPNPDEEVKPWGESSDRDSNLYTDESTIYAPLPHRIKVHHSLGGYGRGDAHINGIESFWSLFRNGFYGTYHERSPKHLHRYVDEFNGRHNIRSKDTIDQVRDRVAFLVSKRLMYKDLVG